MLYLLKLEWIKLNKLLSFRIFTIFYFVLLPSILLTGKRVDERELALQEA